MADYSQLVDELKPGLDSPRPEGKTIWSYCPCHEDGKKHRRGGQGRAGRSLALDPRFGLKCWNGCTDPPDGFKRVVDALRARGGRNSRPVSPKSGGKRDDVPDWWYGDPQCEYEYRDPYTGDLVGVKGRWNGPAPPDGGKPPKEFRWKKPGTPWGIHLGKTPEPLGKSMTDLPLYRAQEIFEADPDRWIWFVEGEKAVHALEAQGELATCGAWSGSQKEFGNAFEILAGRKVRLGPDNDEVGYEYMRRVWMALRGTVAHIVTVRFPVPPSGDAYEYFRAGGTIERLLEGMIVEPVIEHRAHDHFVVKLPANYGGPSYQFEFAGLRPGPRDALDCRLTVTQLGPDAPEEPYPQRINIMSDSARKGLVTTLGKYFENGRTMNWTKAITTAISRVEQAFRHAERGIQVGKLPRVRSTPFLIDVVLPRGKPTLFFGDGDSGKTYIVYSMALAVAMGEDAGWQWMGFEVRVKGGVLIVDYENGEGEDALLRLRRLLKGIHPEWGADLRENMIDELPLYFWPTEGQLLVDQADALREFCDRHGVELIIIDAGADAAGQPRDDEAVLAFYNALASIGRTAAIIHHQINPDEKSPIPTRRPYGSRYWHNRARRTWQVEVDGKRVPGSPIKDIRMSARKNNDGPWPRPMRPRLLFDDNDQGDPDWPDDPSAVSVELRDVGDERTDDAAVDDVPATLVEAVYDLLQSRGPLRQFEIVAELDAKEGSVKTTLYRHEGKRWRKVTGANGVYQWEAI